MKNELESTLLDKPRFQIQVFCMDNHAENPVLKSFGVTLPDAASTEFLSDMMQRQIQLLTYKPMTDGR